MVLNEKLRKLKERVKKGKRVTNLEVERAREQEFDELVSRRLKERGRE